MITNKVGLEAEFFVTNENNNLVFPGEYGFETDEFIILGEFRAKEGSTRSETIANFFKAYYDVLSLAKTKKVNIDISPYKIVDLDFYSSIMRKLGTKEISQSKNLYGTDIRKLSDAIIEKGKIVAFNLSIGLHIHFTSADYNEKKIQIPSQDNYSLVNLPIALGDQIKTSLQFYQKNSTSQSREETISSSCSRITKPVLEYIIKKLDENILPNYLPDWKLKFRKPGYYELKYHGGFEYRSLPMSQNVINDIFKIVDYSFSLLEELELK